MAQAGQTPIQLYHSNTTGSVPTSANLVSGELAINMMDGKLFYKDGSNNVNTIATVSATAGYYPKITFTGDETEQVTAAAPWAWTNASFTQANSADSLARAGYTQANASNNLATSGYAQANIALTLTEASFTQANAGTTSAQSGYTHANATNELATAGYGKANAANNLAVSSYAQANAANTLARSAYNKANAAMSVGLTNTNNDILGTIIDVHTIRFDEDSGFSITEMGTGVAKVAINSTFKYWEVDGQQTIVAEGLDTIKFVGTNGVFISTDPTAPKSITFSANGAYDQANVADILAQAAFSQANASNTLAGSSFVQANASNTLARAAYTRANTAHDGIALLHSINAYQNTYLDDASITYTAAYAQANAATESAQASYEHANNAYDYSVIALDVNQYQNTTISAVRTFAASSYTKANAVGTSTAAAFERANVAPYAYAQANTVDVLATAGFEQANAANNLAQTSYDAANTNASDILLIQGVNVYQNTRITAVDAYATSGYTKTNAVSSYSVSAYTQANAATESAQSGYDKANTLNELTNASFVKSNASNNLAQTGFDKANAAFESSNTKFSSSGGFITGFANVSSNVSVGTHLDFNADVTKPANKEGRVFYDKDQKALAYYNESSMTGQILQESVVRVWNNTGTEVTDGKAVRISGTSSANGFPSIALGDASTYDGSEIIGITTTIIPNGGYGYVTQQGKVNGLNTSTYTEGDEIYLSSGATGTWQSSAPAAPDVAVRLGVIAKVDAVNGSVLVDISFREGVNKTTGAILFGYNESIHEDPSNLFWDHTNRRLGINTNTPQANLHVLGDAIFSSNVTITGNLFISNAQSITTSTLNVGGNTIILSGDVTGTPTSNADIIVNRGTSSNVYITWDESIDEWIMYEGSGTPGHILHSEKTAKTWADYSAMAPYEKSTHPIGANLANTTNELAKGAFAQGNSTLITVNSLATLTPAAFNQANAANELATSGYGQANAANELSTSGYGQANAANELATSGYSKSNSANILAQAAFAKANAANNLASSAYVVANATINLQTVNDEQNTSIIAINEYSTSSYEYANSLSNYAGAGFSKANAATISAQAAFNKANIAVVSAQAAFNKSNTAFDDAAYALAVVDSQNTSIAAVDYLATVIYGSSNNVDILATTAFASGNNNSNTITLIQGVDVYQNTRIAAVDAYAQSGYNVANATIYLQSVNDVQNNSIIAVNNYSYATSTQANAANVLATSSFELANAANNLAQSAFQAANTAGATSAAAAFEQANSANNLAQSAFDAANTGTTAGFAYSQANAATESAQAAFFKANNADIYAQTGYNQANSATLIGLSSTSLAQAAYNKANSITAGTIATYIYTAANTAPLGPIVGDKWYDTTTDILFEYISDGTNEVWVDIDSPTLTTETTNLTINNTYTGYGRSAAMAIVFGGF